MIPQFIRKSSIFLLALFAFLSLPISVAHATDIPVLSWEVGKEHNIKLKSPVDRGQWVLKLFSMDSTTTSSPLTFSPSISTSKNQKVYTLTIPTNFPLGKYRIQVSGYGVTPTTVAQVKIIPLNYFQLSEIPKELFIVLSFYIFVTAALSVLRTRKFARLSYFSQINSSDTSNDSELSDEESFLDSGKRTVSFELISESGNEFVEELLANNADTTEIGAHGPHHQRSRTAKFRLHRILESLVSTLPESLFKVIVLRERAHLYLISPLIWTIAPIFGMVSGAALSILQLHDGGITFAPVYIYFLLSLITVIDLLSGLLGFSAFFLIQLFFGHPKNIREVLAIGSIAVIAVLPILIFSVISLLGDNSPEDADRDEYSRTYGISYFVAAALSALCFYVGVILTYSLHITISDPKLSIIFPLGIGIALVTKNLVTDQQLSSVTKQGSRDSAICLNTVNVGRVFSPLSSLYLLLSLIGVIYIWLQNWIQAVEISFLLTLPYFYLFSQGKPFGKRFFTRIKRSWLIESILIVGICGACAIFIEKIPAINLQRTHIFLFLAAAPLSVHALFSSLWNAADRDVPQIDDDQEGEFVQ